MFNQTRNSKINDLTVEDRAYHDWYRFVLSFPPHLVRHYLDQFGANAGSMVLDPFCGTGTTLVESKKLGIASVGCEANPVTHFASTVKLNSVNHRFDYPHPPAPSPLHIEGERTAHNSS